MPGWSDEHSTLYAELGDEPEGPKQPSRLQSFLAPVGRYIGKQAGRFFPTMDPVFASTVETLRSRGEEIEGTSLPERLALQVSEGAGEITQGTVNLPFILGAAANWQSNPMGVYNEIMNPAIQVPQARRMEDVVPPQSMTEAYLQTAAYMLPAIGDLLVTPRAVNAAVRTTGGAIEAALVPESLRYADELAWLDRIPGRALGSPEAVPRALQYPRFFYHGTSAQTQIQTVGGRVRPEGVLDELGQNALRVSTNPREAMRFANAPMGHPREESALLRVFLKDDALIDATRVDPKVIDQMVEESIDLYKLYGGEIDIAQAWAEITRRRGLLDASYMQGKWPAGARSQIAESMARMEQYPGFNDVQWAWDATAPERQLAISDPRYISHTEMLESQHARNAVIGEGRTLARTDMDANGMPYRVTVETDLPNVNKFDQRRVNLLERELDNRGFQVVDGPEGKRVWERSTPDAPPTGRTSQQLDLDPNPYLGVGGGTRHRGLPEPGVGPLSVMSHETEAIALNSKAVEIAGDVGVAQDEYIGTVNRISYELQNVRRARNTDTAFRTAVDLIDRMRQRMSQWGALDSDIAAAIKELKQEIVNSVKKNPRLGEQSQDVVLRDLEDYWSGKHMRESLLDAQKRVDNLPPGLGPPPLPPEVEHGLNYLLTSGDQANVNLAVKYLAGDQSVGSLNDRSSAIYQAMFGQRKPLTQAEVMRNVGNE